MAIKVAFWCFVRAVTKLRSHSHVVSGLGSTWTNTIIISNCCPVVECLWCLHTLSPAICWKSARSYETSDHIVMNVPSSEILIWICPVQEDFFFSIWWCVNPSYTQFSYEVWIPAKSHCLKDLICGSWFSCFHLAKWAMERASSSYHNFQED